MNIQELTAIIVPSIALIFQTGVISQVIRELKKISADHEARIRKMEEEKHRARMRRMQNPEKNQNRM